MYYRISSWIMPTAKFFCECKLPCRVHYPPLATFTTNSATLGLKQIKFDKNNREIYTSASRMGHFHIRTGRECSVPREGPHFSALSAPKDFTFSVWACPNNNKSLLKEDYILSTYIFKIKYLQWFFSQNVV